MQSNKKIKGKHVLPGKSLETRNWDDLTQSKKKVDQYECQLKEIDDMLKN